MRRSNHPDRFLLKALPRVLAREPRGRRGGCGEPIRREDPYSREAIAARTPAALVFASDALNRIRRDGFAFAHHDPLSRPPRVAKP